MFSFSFKYFRSLYIGLAFLFGVIFFGTYGYVYIEDYTVIEGFYMTLITVSTVGYGEVQPLSDNGRLFTSLLIISSFGTFAYVATSIGSSILSGKYKDILKYYKLEKKILELSGHTIVCGYGNNGEAAVSSLGLHNRELVVIEKDPSKLEMLKHQRGILYIEGNATEDDNFIQAGIENADSLITTLPSDADNVFVCLTARQLNPNLTIISRATSPKSKSKLRLAGADNVIMPDRVGGNHMASLVTRPDINEFLDLLSITNSSSVNLEEVVVKRVEKPISVRNLVESMNMKIRIIGIKKINNEYILSPDYDAEILEGEKLFVLGEREFIEELVSQFSA